MQRERTAEDELKGQNKTHQTKHRTLHRLKCSKHKITLRIRSDVLVQITR